MRVLLNGKREVTGCLRGYDAKEVVTINKTNNIGVVVIRGNSIIQMELLPDN